MRTGKGNVGLAIVIAIIGPGVIFLPRVSVAQNAPNATDAEVTAAIALSAPIPTDAVYQPNWNSLQQNDVPQWLSDAKFGIMMHWGLYSSTATHNEWDEKYIYGANSSISNQFTTNFGTRDTFGYLDVLNPNLGPNATGAAAYAAAGSPYEPFTADNFDPTAWATLFKASGAKYVTMTAEHHDGFALWNSQVTPFNTVNFGPHQDLVGELSTAVHAAGLKFGVQNHEMENYDFIAQVVNTADPNQGPVGPGIVHTGGNLTEPNDFGGTISYTDSSNVTHVLNRQDFYRPDLKTYTDGNDALTHFLDDWYARNVELINDYHPDLIYFDNGVNPRVLDPLKEKVAAYYYNQALTWSGSPQVTITAKSDAYLGGATEDYEKTIPTSIQAIPFQVEQTLTNGTTWGYNVLGGSNSGFNTNTATFVHDLVHITALNGTMLLNIAPKPDGTIPTDEQTVLTGIGNWLAVNGEAIYGTHPWISFAEGSTSSGAHTSSDFRFTTGPGSLYAIMMGWPTSGSTATIQSLGKSDIPGSSITGVYLLGYGPVSFTQGSSALTINLPNESLLADPNYAFAFRISGTGLMVPEPSSAILFGIGLVFFSAVYRLRPIGSKPSEWSPKSIMMKLSAVLLDIGKSKFEGAV